MKIAVFDIGTNSIHMVIAEVRSDLSYEELGHEKDVTRLGDGSFASKRLTKPAMRRALEVIGRFHKIALKSGVTRTVAVATSAVREARNGGEFVEEIRRRTGLHVNVISGEEEGRLVFLAARSSIDTGGRKTLAIDVGGGSMELVLGSEEKIHLLESHKLGATRLTERFVSQDPPSKKDLRRMERHVEKELKKSVKRIRRTGASMVIGTSGTLINLAAMVYADRTSKPLKLVNQYRFERKDLERVHRKLVRMDQRRRLRIPGLDPKRADIIVAGSVLVTTLLRMLKADAITVSDRNIREGLVIDFIEKNKKRLRGEDDRLPLRERSVMQLARRCHYEEGHARQVTRLALQLFDQTRRLHGLGARERELLGYAGILHDIGHYMSFRKHHKHSYYLIVNSDLDGFSPDEIETIGTVAKYHRKALDEKDAAMNGRKKSKYAAAALGALLRVADGLDRTHFSVVKSVRCDVKPRKVVLKAAARPRQDTELELWAAAERADLFERVFGRRLEVVAAERRGS